MSAFSAYSETAFAESEVRLDANAFLSATVAIITVGTIDNIYLTANPVSPAVTATTASGTLQVNVTENLDSVSAATALGALTLDAQASTTLPAVTSTTATTAFDDVDAQASVIPSAATSTSTAGTIDTIHLTANIVSPATTATFNNGGIEDADAQATASVTGVSATTASGTQTANGKATIVSPAATATFTADSFEDVDAQATIQVSGLLFGINNYELLDEDAQGRAYPTGVSATGASNWDTVNGIYAVQITFTADDFARERTVNIAKYGNYTAYITY
jgi:hypothetical protein